ncbi:MAG: hypothetical protein M9939_12310 [Mesorhizobium sp.]|nr:hypothetical protein [Mesorhizobium sp.]MCO5161916.1 hypothetical protein [Mesorhizobium sp.]
MPMPKFNILAAFGRVLESSREMRAAARTRRIIANLPRGIQKDIGWPDAMDEPLQRGR